MRIFFILAAMFSITSCVKPKPDPPKPDPPKVEEEKDDKNSVHDYLWSVRADTSHNGRMFIHWPVIHGENVIFHHPDMKGFVCLNRRTGEIVWDNRGNAGIHATTIKLSVYDNKIYKTSGGELQIVNMETGVYNSYSVPTSKSETYIGVEVFQDEIFINNTQKEMFGSDEKYCGYISFPNDNVSLESRNEIVSLSPGDFNNLEKYFGGYCTIYLNEKGERILFSPLGEYTVNFEDTYYEQSLFAYNMTKDTVEWYKRDFLPTSEYLHPGISPKTVLEGNFLYLKIGHGVVCINKFTGETIWKYFFPNNDDGMFRGQIRLMGDKIIIIGQDDYRVCLNKSDGSIVWEIKAGGHGEYDYHAGGYARGEIGFCEENGRLYYISGWGHLVSLDPNDGSLRIFYLKDYADMQNLMLTMDEKEGIVYSSDGYSMFAFSVPDKDW